MTVQDHRYTRGTEAPMDFDKPQIKPGQETPFLSAFSRYSDLSQVQFGLDKTKTRPMKNTPEPFKSMKNREPVIESSDSEQDYMIPRKRKKTWNQPHHGEHYLELPYMITGYIQAMASIIAVSILLYFIVMFIWTVHHDLQMKADGDRITM